MIHKRFIKNLVISVFTLMPLVASFCAQAIQFELGASLSTVVTRVADTSENDSNADAVAVIATKATFVPYFALIGKENYFSKDTDFGWTYQVWGSTFSVDQQEIDGQFKDDFGTRLTGSYLYALPQIYYRFGDRFSAKPVRHWRVTMGIGYGISYVTLNGDLRITKTASDTHAQTKQIDASDIYYSFGLFVKAAYDRYFISISNNSPQLRDGDNDLLFRIHNVSYTIGYEFIFDFELTDLFK